MIDVDILQILKLSDPAALQSIVTFWRIAKKPTMRSTEVLFDRRSRPWCSMCSRMRDGKAQRTFRSRLLTNRIFLSWRKPARTPKLYLSRNVQKARTQLSAMGMIHLHLWRYTTSKETTKNHSRETSKHQEHELVHIHWTFTPEPAGITRGA